MQLWIFATSWNSRYRKIRRDNIKGSRSKKLYTVDLGNDTVKSFYDGRMVGTKVLVPIKKSAFRIFAEKLLGRKTQMAS